MATIEATVEEMDGEYSLKIQSDPDPILIPISKNDANAVKDAFNRLLQLVQEAPVKINLLGVGDDLFSQVTQEYVKQLNHELKEIRKEMDSNGLTAN